MDTASSVFCDDKYTSVFNKQARCYGSNVKNGLKVKQLTKHLPTLKMLMGKILVLDSWLKNFTFSILNSLKLNFSTTLARENLIVYTSV